MHFHLPKPLHGWREFAGEVGIIVIGVLIALGAEQMVETWHSRTELREFRSALNREAEYNLAAYEFRLRQSGCVQRRISELERWEKDWRNGRAQPLTVSIGAPTHLALLTSVWRERTGSITEHMSLGDRLAYGRLYDWLDNFNMITTAEHDTWHALREYEVASKLDQGQEMRLHTLIESAAGSDRVIQSNWGDVLSVARPLGLKPIHDPREPKAGQDICSPILPPPAGR